MASSTHSEQWKDIPGYEGLYAISTHGRIRSYPKVVRNGWGLRTIPGRLREPEGPSKTCRYKAIQLVKDHKTKRFLVHRLVVLTWIGTPPVYSTKTGRQLFADVNHKDGNKLNNKIDNLEYCTRSQNIRHAFAIGIATRSKARRAA